MKLDRPCSLADLPIPQDVRVTRRWTAQMCEMAVHIGPYRTLLVVDALGGQTVHIPRDPAANQLRRVIGEDGAKIMSAIYAGNKMTVPVGRAALLEARRAGVIAAVRAGTLKISDAAPILGTSRTYLSHLVNASREGEDAAPIDVHSLRRDTRQLDMFTPPESAESA